MSCFDEDPNEQANISGADLAILVEERDLLKAAIEAMRTAGGSEEFQIAFDRAKELASAL